MIDDINSVSWSQRLKERMLKPWVLEHTEEVIVTLFVADGKWYRQIGKPAQLPTLERPCFKLGDVTFTAVFGWLTFYLVENDRGFPLYTGRLDCFMAGQNVVLSDVSGEARF